MNPRIVASQVGPRFHGIPCSGWHPVSRLTGK